jgi:hypothetical protein
MIWTSQFRVVRLTTILLCAFSFARPAAQIVSGATFPLSEGTYWIYRGIVRWTHDNSNEVSETAVQWRMEVRKCMRRRDILAAVVNGFPADLNWSDGHPNPKNSLIIQSGEEKFYLIPSDEVDKVLKTVQDPNGSLTSVLSDDNIFLDLPLAKGKKFCDPEGMARSDSHYCWVVESAGQVSLNGVKGISPGLRTAYNLTYRTNPDDEEITYVGGIGLVAYEYHHHGTTADTELKLVEFHQGANP